MTTLLLIPLFALCSALHGWGKVGKGIVVALQLLGACGIALIAGLPWFFSIGFSALSGGLFWGTMRRGWHAKAEIDYMAGYPFASMYDVTDGYAVHTIVAGLVLGALGWWRGDALAMWLALPVALSFFLPAISLLIFNYHTAIGRKLQNNGRFIDTRRPTELFGGMVGGIVASVVLYVMAGL